MNTLSVKELFKLFTKKKNKSALISTLITFIIFFILQISLNTVIYFSFQNLISRTTNLNDVLNNLTLFLNDIVLLASLGFFFFIFYIAYVISLGFSISYNFRFKKGFITAIFGIALLIVDFSVLFVSLYFGLPLFWGSAVLTIIYVIWTIINIVTTKIPTIDL